MMPRSWSFIAAACALLACSEDENFVRGAPAGPSMGGADKRDAGEKPEPEEDAGPMDAGSPLTYCTRITLPPGGTDDNPIATYVVSPGDLTLSRQVESWSNDCSNLRLILEFSDGACPVGLGHSIKFSFGYRDFIDGVIHGGNNMIGAEKETPAVSVRYVRPKRLEPKGTWGTCEGAEGQLVFVEAPMPQAGNYLRARYQLSLSPCEGTTGEPQFLDGAFNVLLRTSASDACPASATSDAGLSL